MDKKVSGILAGSVTPPPSKSQAHRLLICAALGTTRSKVTCDSLNDDLRATMDSLNALGASITYADGAFDVVCDIFVCILICAVAFFDRREKSRVLYCTLVYAAVSVVLGGAMSALFVLFNRIGLDRLLGSEDDADGISVWLFALLAFLSGIGAACGGRVFKKRSAKRFCALELTFCGKSIRLRALYRGDV